MTKKVFAWSLYDFADTAYSALFVTFFFPILIKTYLGGNEFQIGLSMGLSLLAAAMIVPLIGALADATGRKIPVLFTTTMLTVLVIALTGYAGLLAALFLGFLANLFSIVDNDLYDSQLVDIASFEERGRVSGFGVAVGYLGTIASLFMGYLIMNAIGWEIKEAVQTIFPATALFYLLFSLPLFAAIKDVPKPKVPFVESLKKALGELKYTLTRMREIKGLGSFLAASFIYNNAMHAVIIFLSLYATKVIGLSIQEFFFVFAALAIGAFLGSLIFGKISDSLGPKKALTGALIIWTLVILYLLGADLSVATFVVAGMIGGAVLGSVWVGNRHMITRLAPPHKMAEIFGFAGLTKKFSGAVGPVIFGLIVYLAGPGNELAGYQNALGSVLVFFVIGLVILWRIPRNVGV